MWHKGLDTKRAVAVYGIVVTLDSFGTATGDYGWSPDEVEEWWHSTLAGQLLR